MRDATIRDLWHYDTVRDNLSWTFIVSTRYCLQSTNALHATKPLKYYTKSNPESVL